jgi:hypothetical protein
MTRNQLFKQHNVQYIVPEIPANWAETCIRPITVLVAK